LTVREEETRATSLTTVIRRSAIRDPPQPFFLFCRLAAETKQICNAL
jgi:hypothetical protein